jgi:hypothetical protein
MSLIFERIFKYYNLINIFARLVVMDLFPSTYKSRFNFINNQTFISFKRNKRQEIWSRFVFVTKRWGQF